MVVGDADTTTTGIFRVALARYDTSGALDPTFGTAGKVLTAVGNVNDRGNDAALQSDGKIVVAGRYTNGPTNDAKYRDIVVLRYNVNGTLDQSFGTGGKVTTAIGSDADEPNGVAIQSDGKILVSGYTNNGTKNDIALLRYTANGTLDTGFGTGGIVTTSIGSLEDGALKVRVQPDGKIVMSAYTDVGSGNIDCALLRYNTTGTLDATFGTGGKVITSFGSGFDAPLQCLILPNGKIVATGISNNGSNFDFALARYSSSGVLDAGFGTGGKVTTPIGSGDDMGFGAALQADGKIVLAGESNSGTNTDFAIVRYLNTGATAVPNSEASGTIPGDFFLCQNYPNPFNPSTVIRYHLPAGQAGLSVNSKVSLKIYDVLGREVATLVNEEQSAGWKEVTWDASGISSGIYLYRLQALQRDGGQAGSFVETKKCSVVK